MGNNFMPNVLKAQSLLQAAMAELDALVSESTGDSQAQASRAASYLLETIAALRIRAPAIPCRLDFVADSAADLAAGSFQTECITPRAIDRDRRAGQTRVNVYLDPPEADQAHRLGCGNLSDGIRKALQTENRTLN